MSYAAISIFAVGFLLAVLVAFTFVEDRRRNAFLLPIWVLTLAATLNWAWIFEWGAGLSTALVGNILATQVAFGGLLLVFRDTIRLTIILGPYLLMALLLVIWSSTSVAGVDTRLPTGTSGPATIKGTPADSSYRVDFPQKPLSPRLSP